jgi:hypothetical protein
MPRRHTLVLLQIREHRGEAGTSQPLLQGCTSSLLSEGHRGAKMSSEVRRRLLRRRHFAVHRFEMIGMKSDEKTPAGVTTLVPHGRGGLGAGKRTAFI